MSRGHYGSSYNQGNRYDSRHNYGSPDDSYPNQEGGYFNSGHAPSSEHLEYENARHTRTRPNPLLRSDTEVEADGTSGYSEQPRPARPNSLLRTDTCQGGGYNPQDRPNPLQRSDTDIEIEGFKRPNLLVRSDTDYEEAGYEQPVRPNPALRSDSEREEYARESSRHPNRAYGEYVDRERHPRGAGSGAYYEGENTYGGGRHGGTSYGDPYESRRPGYGDDEGQGSYGGYNAGGYGRPY